MAKRFAYVSFGILCLVAAYQLGAERARADWDLSLPGQIIGGAGDQLFWSRSGEAWFVVSDSVWQRAPQFDLPVPADEVKILTGPHNDEVKLITTGDEAWAFHGPANDWVFVGPFPGTPVSLESESLGGIKAKYR